MYKQTDSRKTPGAKGQNALQDFCKRKNVPSTRGQISEIAHPILKSLVKPPQRSVKPLQETKLQERPQFKNPVIDNQSFDKQLKEVKSGKTKRTKSAKLCEIPKTSCYAFLTNSTEADRHRDILSRDIRSAFPRCLSLEESQQRDEEKTRSGSVLIFPKQLDIVLTEPSEQETYFSIQQRVKEAVKNKKIFLIRGDIPYLEDTLKRRGWVQKYECSKTRHLPYGSVSALDAPSLGDIRHADGALNEKYITFNILKHISPSFIWDCRNDFIEWSGLINHDTLLNRLQKSYVYTSKLGMATILENVHWYNEEGIASVFYPRSYNVVRDEAAFIEDYRRTAVVSLLKWFAEKFEQDAEAIEKVYSPVPPKQIEFAIQRCKEIVAIANDEYLDVPKENISSQEWNQFIEDYIKAVHEDSEAKEGLDFTEIDGILLHDLCMAIVDVLKKVIEVDPQYELNGMRNIWILKPSNLCCGTGIIMSHKLGHIIRRVHDCARDYFLVQKYIEKPLLVHDTKFDVRQWYLITVTYPLTIWIYNSKRFTFDNYHEAIHICNTAIQNKYVRVQNSIRSQDWDCEKLNQYLKEIGHKGEPWYDEVYPKIRQAIIATMLAAQDHMDKRKHSFELYGADFMVMNDLSVWLIEINTNPRMHPPSTRITRRLYPDVLDSLIKVVMDYPTNPEADTGNFVLAYKQNVTDFQPYLGTCMFAFGKSMQPKPYPDQ